MNKDKKGDPQKVAIKQEPEAQQAASQPDDNSCVPTNSRVTESVALARAKALITNYKPTTVTSMLIHRIFTFFTLSVDSGYPVFSKHLIACYTDKDGNDVGEPSPASDEWKYLYLHGLFTNLEDMIEPEPWQKGIAEQAKSDFWQMWAQATDNAALAKAYLDINDIVRDFTVESNEHAQYAFVACLAGEFVKARRANPDFLVSLRDKVRDAAQKQSAEQVQSGCAEKKGEKSGKRQNKQWLDKVCKEVLMLWNSWCANGGRKRYRDFLEAHKGRPVFQTYIKDVDDLKKCLNAAKKAEKQKNAGK